jgi:hypothetical protein
LNDIHISFTPYPHHIHIPVISLSLSQERANTRLRAEHPAVKRANEKKELEDRERQEREKQRLEKRRRMEERARAERARLQEAAVVAEAEAAEAAERERRVKELMDMNFYSPELLQQIRIELARIYSMHSPEKIRKIDRLLAKYTDREMEFLRFVLDKYDALASVDFKEQLLAHQQLYQERQEELALLAQKGLGGGVESKSGNGNNAAGNNGDNDNDNENENSGSTGGGVEEADVEASDLEVDSTSEPAQSTIAITTGDDESPNAAAPEEGGSAGGDELLQKVPPRRASVEREKEKRFFGSRDRSSSGATTDSVETAPTRRASAVWRTAPEQVKLYLFLCSPSSFFLSFFLSHSSPTLSQRNRTRLLKKPLYKRTCPSPTTSGYATSRTNSRASLVFSHRSP